MKNITLRPQSLLTLLFVVVPAVVAGGACTEEPTAPCTEVAAVSVTVNVTGNAGDAINDAIVSFTVDGGAASDCSFLADGDYLCGTEQSGDFVITISRPGFITETATATVAADECHVIGESVAVVLDVEGA